ncbi:MAG: protein-L-isoaspartate(D-aspartate) O-methyltransferase [Thermoplasmatota archaeon]
MDDCSRKNLVSCLVDQGYIKSPSVKKAFLAVSREKFVPIDQKSYAYLDKPLQIGNNQTISAPHMVAIMCESLDIKPGHKILEVGSGSGYHAAIVSKLVGDSGHIYSVERIEKLAKKAQDNLKSENISNVTIVIGDGSEGLSTYQPYDRIYVTCAAPQVPQMLIDQLANHGKLLIPVGDMYCELQLIQKIGQKIKIKNLGGCVFVPLIGRYGQHEK